MKKVRITFDNIVQLRKFEGSISFLGFPYTINEELMEIELEAGQIRQPYRIEMTSKFVSVTFRSHEQ